MSDNINHLLKDIDRENKYKCYQNHNRLIPKELWDKLKAKRKCDGCGEVFKQPLYIHHKKSVSVEPDNSESNLQTLCWECHQKADKETKVNRIPKQHFSWWKH